MPQRTFLTALVFSVVLNSAGNSQEQSALLIKSFDDTSTVSDKSLDAFQRKHSLELPSDYRTFLRTNNGGFPNRDCVEFKEASRQTATDVFCFFAMDDKREWASINWHLSTYGDRTPKQTLPIARDSQGNLWLLGLGENNSGHVYFWDHGTFDTFDETELARWPLISKTFQEFTNTIGTYDAKIEDGVVISRYAITQQAIKSMADRDNKFSVQANPGFAWHCDCDANGRVRMQFVDYRVHAVATHTDGYSRISAIKGLIKDGPPRLPK